MSNDLEELSIKDGKLVDSESNEVKVERLVGLPILIQCLDSNKYEDNKQYFLKILDRIISGSCDVHANAFLRGDIGCINKIECNYGCPVQLYQIKKS